MKTVAAPSAPETFTTFSIQDGGSEQRFVRLHDAATERLERHVVSRHPGAGEWSGLLWGAVHVDAAAGERWIDVVDAEPVVCDRMHAAFANCPLRCFEKALRAQPRNGHRKLTLVGYYRGASDHLFRKDDEQIFGSHFGNGERLALMIKTPKDDVPTGVWFLGLGGKLRAGRATVEFPVSLRELTGVEPAPPAPVAEPVAPPVAAVAAPPAPAETKTEGKSSAWKLGIAGLLVAGGATAFLLRPSDVAPPVEPAPVTTEAPALTTPPTTSLPEPKAVVPPPSTAPKTPVPVTPAPIEPVTTKPTPKQFQPNLTPIAAPNGPDQLIAPPPVQAAPLGGSAPVQAPVVPSGAIPPAPKPAAPAPQPSQQTVAGPTTPAKLIKRAEPPRAEFRGEATIDVRVDIDATGKVIGASAVNPRKGQEAAVAAALAAARGSQFEAARSGGQPVAGQATMQVRVQGDTIRLSNPALR